MTWSHNSLGWGMARRCVLWTQLGRRACIWDGEEAQRGATGAQTTHKDVDQSPNDSVRVLRVNARLPRSAGESGHVTAALLRTGVQWQTLEVRKMAPLHSGVHYWNHLLPMHPHWHALSHPTRTARRNSQTMWPCLHCNPAQAQGA
jgi:hypothetical protein